MADKKSVGHAYNIDFLNVVFAASSIFLFISVIWMVWDDYDREWKNTQRRFVELETQVTQAGLEQAAKGVDQKKLAELQAQLGTAEQNVAANQQRVDEIRAGMSDVEARLAIESQAYQFAKATYDQDRYDFEAARANKDPSAEARGQAVAELRSRMNELDLQAQKTTAERAALRTEQDALTGEVTKIQGLIAELHLEETRLNRRLAVLAPSLVKDYFRNAPLLDFMAPTITVRQLMLPNVVDDVNFVRVMKMDRCQTCHLAIDRPGYEKFPQPYTTHPNLSDYLSGGSPHPMDQVGCTVCHEGMGQSISFRDASHMPPNEEIKARWEEEYHWEEPHMWDFPMLPTPMTEASCAKCHKREIYVPKAEALNVAYATYERAGCYACHKTRGFEDLRKPGPILTKIDSKLSEDWVRTWLRNPRAVKATTWMPRIWYNSNSNTPEDAMRNEVEINAATSYLFANATASQPVVANPPRGDAARGQAIVKNVGCLGCHAVDEKTRAEAGPHRTFGQPLQNIGNKTTYAWLYDWVRDPKHYSPTTYMPDLRLTDAQVADVATYLSTLKSSGGDAPTATPDQAAVDAVLLDYYRALLPFEEAKVTVSKLDGAAKQQDLGRRVINRYGCYSCHEIKGFENEQPIGTELSEAGSKLVTRLDFAFVKDLPHTSKIAWYKAKLHDPRVFDQGRELQPLEKLRMPNFDFTEEEAASLATALMSFQAEIQPPAAMPVKNARRDFLTSGRALVHRRNCVGCHVIEGSGGDFTKLLSDPSLGPPLLTPEGARVQHDWLYAFLRAPITIRPWLEVRMPTFGLDDQNLNGVIQYFGSVSNKMGSFRSPTVTNVGGSPAGSRELFDLLKCQQCHVLGEIPRDQPTSNLAPDLRMAYDRLQPEWIADWLRNPATIVPGTRMPSFWPDHPKSFYPQFGNNAEAQIQAIVGHLLSLRGGPSPRPGATRADN